MPSCIFKTQSLGCGIRWWICWISPDNSRKSSVSAMLVYVFAKAVRMGFLDSDFLSAAGRAYSGLLENMIKVDASGILTLEGTCSAAGLGKRFPTGMVLMSIM